MKKIVCVSNIDWDFLWQRHQIFMEGFSKQYEIIFINNTGIRKLTIVDFKRIISKFKSMVFKIKKKKQTISNSANEEGIRVINPIVLPPNNRIFKFINEKFLFKILYKKLYKLNVKDDDILWTYIPNQFSYCLINYFQFSNIIYDCNVNFSEIKDVDLNMSFYENFIVNKSKLLITDSKFLQNKLFTDYNCKPVSIPPGVDITKFNPNLKSESNELDNIKGKKIIFFGGIAKLHTDYELLIKLAEVFINYNLIIIGTIKDHCEELFSKKNVRYLGCKKHDDIPSYLVKSDVILLPYLKNNFTNGVIPAKLFECIAVNKPIVAINIPELTDYSSNLMLSENHEQFLNNVRVSLNKNCSFKTNYDYAKKNTWNNRIETLKKLINDMI